MLTSNIRQRDYRYPSYNGVVNNLKEAHLLLEATRMNIIPRVTKRLTDNEKVRFIKPGAVFIWEEEESGILRWTDSHKWSASRVSGSFLVYSAIDSTSLSPEDTLVKQSFFSVDAAGSRMHLMAYSSRKYRLGDGVKSVSEDIRFAQVPGFYTPAIPISLRPRVVSTSHCFDLVNTTPVTKAPIVFSPSEASTSTSSSRSSSITYRDVSPSFPQTTGGFSLLNQPRLSYRASSPNLRISSSNTTTSIPLRTHRQVIPLKIQPQPLLISTPPKHNYSTPLIQFHRSVSNLRSLLNDNDEEEEDYGNSFTTTFPTSTFSSLPQVNTNLNLNFIPRRTSSSSSSSTSRSRSITPTTPSEASSPSLENFPPPSSSSSNSGIRSPPHSPRYRPYSRERSPNARNIPPILYRSTSFDSALNELNQMKLDLDLDPNGKKNRDSFGLLRKYRSRNFRESEDVRVLSLFSRMTTVN